MPEWMVVVLLSEVTMLAGPPGAPAAAGKKPGKFARGLQEVLSPASCALSGASPVPPLAGSAARQAPTRPNVESPTPGPLVTGTKWGAGLPLVYRCCS